MAEAHQKLKCCSNGIIVMKESHLKHGDFLFPYSIVYCSGCGEVKATTFIKDAIKS
jgi:hypothetical protein